jgi:hypothetical protein
LIGVAAIGRIRSRRVLLGPRFNRQVRGGDFGAILLSTLWLRLCFGSRTAGPGKGIDPLSAATTATALAGTPTLTTTAFPITTATATATGGRGALGVLGTLLGHQLIELARFELLGQGAQGEAENGHGRA